MFVRSKISRPVTRAYKVWSGDDWIPLDNSLKGIILFVHVAICTQKQQNLNDHAHSYLPQFYALKAQPVAISQQYAYA